MRFTKNVPCPPYTPLGTIESARGLRPSRALRDFSAGSGARSGCAAQVVPLSRLVSAFASFRDAASCKIKNAKRLKRAAQTVSLVPSCYPHSRLSAMLRLIRQKPRTSCALQTSAAADSRPAAPIRRRDASGSGIPPAWIRRPRPRRTEAATCRRAFPSTSGQSPRSMLLPGRPVWSVPPLR